MEVIFLKFFLIFRFSPNEPFYYDTDVINDNIQYKKEFSNWSEKFESTGSDFTYILFSCLFYSKSKTLSHLRESLLFYKDAINHITVNQETQKVLLSALFDVWGHSTNFLKFLITFLLNNNIIDHLVLVKFIFEKIKDNLNLHGDVGNLNEFENKNSFMLIKNYFLLNLIDYILEHCEKSLDRLKSELTKEQESLAVSDETIQTGIIKSIEFLEENIEKVIGTSKTIKKDTFLFYSDFYCSMRENNLQEKNFVFEKIIFFLMKNKKNLISELDNVSVANKEIDHLIVNLKHL